LVLVDSSHIDQFWRSAAVLPPESPNEGESLKFYREWFTNPPSYPALHHRLFEAGSLGDMPLVVLTSPVKERAADLPPGLSAEFDEPAHWTTRRRCQAIPFRAGHGGVPSLSARAV
jgi:hypothetical protein